MRRTWLGFLGLMSLGVGAVLVAGIPAQADCDDDDDCCYNAPACAPACCPPAVTTTCCDPCAGNYMAGYRGPRRGLFGWHRRGYYANGNCCTVGYTGGAIISSGAATESSAPPVPVAPPPPPNGGGF
jgi:hypothetical protein